MSKALPEIPGMELPGMGHNNPPESEKIDLEYFKALNGVAIFKDDEAIQNIISTLKAGIDGFESSVETEESRKEISSYAYSLTRVKNIIDDKGKELNSDLRKKIDAVDKKRRDLRAGIDAFITSVRGPLDVWNAKEADRKNALEAAAKEVNMAFFFQKEPTLEEIDQRIALVKKYEQFDWQEKSDTMPDAVKQSMSNLLQKRAEREQQIKDQQELQRLRALQAAQEEKEKAEQSQPADSALSGTVDDQNSVAPSVAQPAPSYQLENPPSYYTEQALLIKKQKNAAALAAISKIIEDTPGSSSDKARAVVVGIVRGIVPDVTINY